MDVRPLPRVTELSPLSKGAYPPISVTLSGMVSAVRDPQ
jgi:hypothetical protein